MRHRSQDEEDFDDEGDGFISGTPAKPRPLSKIDVVGSVKRAASNPIVIAGFVIVMLLYWRPWAGSATVVMQGATVASDANRRSAASDDVVVVDTTSTSSTKVSDDDNSKDISDEDSISVKVVQVKTSDASAPAATSGSDDVIVVDSSVATAVATGGDGGDSKIESDGKRTTNTVVSNNGELTTTIHAVDEFGTPPPSPPPRAVRSAASLKEDRERAQKAAEWAKRPRVTPRQLEEMLKKIEAGLAARSPPHDMMSMLAQTEKLFYEAKVDDISFNQRERLKRIEEGIQKAKGITKLAMKLAEGEFLIRTNGAPEAMRQKLYEITNMIKEAGPDVDQNPVVKAKLEAQLEEVDRQLKAQAYADEERRRHEHEERMKRVRDDDARRRDRERTEAEARRQADIRGGARGGASGAPPSELDVLRAKIDRMQREGGDDLVISALKEKWERMAAEAMKLKGVPSGGPRPAEVTDGYSIEQDKDGDGEAEVVIVGKKGTLPRKARRKIRGLFRGGASAGAKTDDDEVEVRSPSNDDQEDRDEEVIVVRRPTKKQIVV